MQGAFYQANSIRCPLVIPAVLMAVGTLMALISTPAQARQPFAEFVQSLWPEARDRFGVSRTTFVRATKGLKPDLSIPDLETSGRKRKVRQAEFTRAPSDYLDKDYLARLAKTGRKLARTYASQLDEARRIADELASQVPASAEDVRFWEFCRERFGLEREGTH